MGFENRDYSRYDESSWQSSYGATSGRTICVTLIIVCVAVFILDMFSPVVTEGFHWLSYQMSLDTTAPWKVWTFLTYGFAHASIDSESGIFHIAGNMITLFFLGRAVEDRLGRLEFLKFYLATIVFAGVATYVLKAVLGQPTIMHGASGAVTGVVCLFIIFFPRQKIRLLFPPVELPAWVLGVILVGYDFMNAFNPANHVAWQAHLAGAVFAGLYFKLGWSFGWLKLEKLSGLFSGKPKLRVHDPQVKLDQLKDLADPVLAKVSEQGEASLTRKERKILNQYSNELKKRNS